MSEDLYTPQQKLRIEAERKALRVPPWLMTPTETLGLPCPDFVTVEADRKDWEEKAQMYRLAQSRRQGGRISGGKRGGG